MIALHGITSTTIYVLLGIIVLIIVGIVLLLQFIFYKRGYYAKVKIKGGNALLMYVLGVCFLAFLIFVAVLAIIACSINLFS